MSICANCRRNITFASCTGVSGLYNPSGPEIELCEPCFLDEDALIDEEGNEQPERLARYKRNLASLSRTEA